MIYDFIIIGSGPAGSVASYCLQKKGLKCLMLEAQKERSEKICGGYLTWSAINLLNQIGINTDYLLDNGAQKIEHLFQLWDEDSKTYNHHCGEYGVLLLCDDTKAVPLSRKPGNRAPNHPPHPIRIHPTQL